MTELFSIFNDNLARQTLKHVSRQPLCNDENRGKTIHTGPVKPNEPMKKNGETKKSFLSNIGKNVQSTPIRKALTPRSVNVATLIYSDVDKETDNKHVPCENLQFTKPKYSYDKYMDNMLGLIPIPEIAVDKSPPQTPPPTTTRPGMEFDCSYEDEFFTDEFSCGNDSDLNLPDLY